MYASFNKLLQAFLRQGMLKVRNVLPEVYGTRMPGCGAYHIG